MPILRNSSCSVNSRRGLNEAEVVSIWRNWLLGRRFFKDIQGQTIEVIYPGRPNDCRGADFKEAVVSCAGQVHRGSIEVHAGVAAWRSHGHQRDPVYNDVILHVAWTQDSSEPTLLQNGGLVPTIVLSESAIREKGPRSSARALPCQKAAGTTSWARFRELIGNLGDQRLEVKAERFRLEIEQMGADQALYLGLLEALGYSHNKQAFRELGQKVPLAALLQLWPTRCWKAGGLHEVESILLGHGGFLPSQRRMSQPPLPYLTRLEKCWDSLGDGWSQAPAWEVCRIRPANHPVRRIIALAWLLFRFRHKGLLPAMLNLVRSSISPPAARFLRQSLVVDARGYWLNHYDLGPPAPRPLPHLLGEVRSAEIVINVLLPFSLAFGQCTSDPELVLRARQVYSASPKLGSNSIQSHLLAQLDLPAREIDTARLQQGLIHLYKTCCILGRCRQCPLRKRLVNQAGG